MSILTKIFIILLTLASLFLCGFVIYYVAFSKNFKELYNQESSSVSKLKNEKASIATELEGEKAKNKSLADSKAREETALQTKINELNDTLNKLNLEKTNLQGQVDKLQSENATLALASKTQTEAAMNSSKEVVTLRNDLIAERKKYEEAAAALLAKESQIDTLVNDRKRLLEEKASLEKKLGRFLQPYGQKPVAETPVTPSMDKAQPVVPVTTSTAAAQIALPAKITAVDMKNNLAKISIGQADGVKLGMRFHISRDGQYICDIRIIDVAAEEAIGTLELVQQEPKVGDNAATNL